MDYSFGIVNSALLRASAECYVECYDGFGSVVHIHCLAELCVEQRLLGFEDLDVAGLAIVHQLMGTLICLIECLYLALVVAVLLTRCHAVGHSLIDFVAGIDNRLHIFALHVFFGEHGYLFVGFQLASREDGLRKLSQCIEENLPGSTVTPPAEFVQPAAPLSVRVG